MNVLGIDSKLSWASHVSKQISKANKALHVINLIKKFFDKEEILTQLLLSVVLQQQALALANFQTRNETAFLVSIS